MINNSEFHSLIFKYEKKTTRKTLIFGIPLPSKRAISLLNKGINEFLKSILKYNKSFFIFKRKIKVNKYK